VFVNPLQFAATEDLSTYPRDLDGDVGLARRSGASVVFAPPLEEMYPGPVLTSLHVAEVGDGMEGASRPTHFDGVATVVAKLFNASGACRAYFGEKDWQQLQVVRRMVADLSFPVDIVGCPIVREADGLAMSSRNVYLSTDERAAATVLHRALLAGAADLSRAGDVTADRVGNVMADVVRTEPRVELDYADVVETDAEYRLLIAARVGRTRLIDNRGVAK
jgi:pantoate--beta-alanine ligase